MCLRCDCHYSTLNPGPSYGLRARARALIGSTPPTLVVIGQNSELIKVTTPTNTDMLLPYTLG